MARSGTPDHNSANEPSPAPIADGASDQQREREAASLAAALVDAEAERTARRSAGSESVQFADDLEHQRRLETSERVPVLQVAGVDFAYGPVQVLFDVHLEVHRGEVLALLGTNGAGKSTVLRVIAGLGTPTRGIVRLNGLAITHMSPERRMRLGIRTLLGGKGVFPAMSVNENLAMAAFMYRSDHADFGRRMARAYDCFPALAARRRHLASALSGGQQQVLALAMTLTHDPEILAIDELSLGLAPLLIQELLTTIERLKSEGTTIILVEQSLNIALTVADRAIFLEKGQVRFSGPAAELAERDDLARAVFLGTDGGP